MGLINIKKTRKLTVYGVIIIILLCLRTLKEYITKQLSNQLSPPGVIYSMYYDMTF